MTKADWIRNNRGIDNGKDMPRQYLEEVRYTAYVSRWSIVETNLLFLLCHNIDAADL